MLSQGIEGLRTLQIGCCYSTQNSQKYLESPHTYPYNPFHPWSRTKLPLGFPPCGSRLPRTHHPFFLTEPSFHCPSRTVETTHLDYPPSFRHTMVALMRIIASSTEPHLSPSSADSMQCGKHCQSRSLLLESSSTGVDAPQPTLIFFRCAIKFANKH